MTQIEVEKKYRDLAMKIMLEWRENEKHAGHHMTPECLTLNGFPESVSVKRTLETLESNGYLEVVPLDGAKDASGKPVMEIVLQPPGLKYFEDDMDKKSDTKKQFAHDWNVSVISTILGAFLGALFSEPLWDFLHWFQSLFT